MHNDNHVNANTENLKTNVLYVKIFIAVCVLVLGAYATLWSIETIDQLINNTENTSLFKTILDLKSDQKPFNISLNGNRFVVENNDAFKFMFVLLTLIVLFNIIGRAITGIFKCLASIIGSLNSSSGKSTNNSNTRT